jgi:hypothetical protein
MLQKAKPEKFYPGRNLSLWTAFCRPYAASATTRLRPSRLAR